MHRHTVDLTWRALCPARRVGCDDDRVVTGAVEVLEDPNVRTIVERGMLWAARGSDMPYGDHGRTRAKEATR